MVLSTHSSCSSGREPHAPTQGTGWRTSRPGTDRDSARTGTVLEQRDARGPLLENRTTGMFRPSSGNNGQLTDVWGSALAVDLGAVAGEREAGALGPAAVAEIS